MNSLIPISAALLGAALMPADIESSPTTSINLLGGQKNYRPICVIQPLAPVVCQGDSTVVQLDGSGSYDVDGDMLTYLWQACPGAVIDDPTSATPTLTFDTSNGCALTCGVRFQVSDGEKFSYCRTLVEIVPDTTNYRPICVIEPLDPVICQGDSTVVQLDGSSSYDVNGDTLSYLWQACPGAVIDDPTSATPTLTFDTSGGCALTCGVRFQVSDGEKVSYCRVLVEIIPDPTPDIMGPFLDIKPGSCPNPVNVQNGAPSLMAKVAISLLGNDIDLNEIDKSTLRLRRTDGVGSEISPIQFNFSDTGTPFMGSADCGCHALGGDGVTDLDLKFYKDDIIGAFLLGGEANNSYLELELVGDFLDGTSFSASDCIRVLRHN